MTGHLDTSYRILAGVWAALRFKKKEKKLTFDLLNKKSVRSVSPSQPDMVLKSHNSLVQASEL